MKYYNPGLYVYTTPTEGNGCSGLVNLSDCTSYGWKEYEPGDDEHYLAGNYYTWLATTVNTGKDLTSGNASGSICPKNWKLPLSGTTNNNTSGSFYKLLNNYYGFVFDKTSGNGSYGGVVSSTGQNIAAAPLYFVLSGAVGTTYLNAVGISAPYWSRTASSGTNAFYLTFGNDSIYPSFSSSRYYGFSIRCLVI